MATIRLPQDFKEFLKLLKEHNVRYLLIGGYAVGFHGYPRATAAMDIWVAIHPDNANKVEDLKVNKRASGRSKDITDLENLP